MSPHRMSDLMRPVLLVMLMLFGVVLIYGFLTKDDDDNDFSVTVTYDCNIVLDKKSDYPGAIVDMCEQLQRNAI